MDSVGKKDSWKQNLNTMRTNLEKSYEFKTIVQEETRLIDGLFRTKQDYVIFSDYRRNEGRRRFEDIKELIDSALEKIDCCESEEAAVVYFRTLKSVLKHTRWAKVLESLTKYSHTS